MVGCLPAPAKTDAQSQSDAQSQPDIVRDGDAGDLQPAADLAADVAPFPDADLANQSDSAADSSPDGQTEDSAGDSGSDLQSADIGAETAGDVVTDANLPDLGLDAADLNASDLTLDAGPGTDSDTTDATLDTAGGSDATDLADAPLDTAVGLDVTQDGLDQTPACTTDTCPGLDGFAPTCNSSGYCEYEPQGDVVDPTYQVYIYVPPTVFEMGSKRVQAQSFEKPVHTVTLEQGFFIGKFEVTMLVYDACQTAGTCKDARIGARAEPGGRAPQSPGSTG